MPKELLKINRFEGGLNTDSHISDLDDSEQRSNDDLCCDRIGELRMMGGTIDHAANEHKAYINPGYGLHSFSTDRTGAHLGEHLSQGDFSGSGSLWDVTTNSGTAATVNSNSLVCTNAGDNYISQAHTKRQALGLNSHTYLLTFKAIVTDGGSFAVSTATVSTFSSTTVDISTDLSTAGTYYKSYTFTSASNASSSNFIFHFVTSGTGNISIDDISLKLWDVPKTRDDYLVLSDSSTTGKIFCYSATNDQWTNNVVTNNDASIISGMTNNDNGNRKDIFHSAVGALRVCDANFENRNENQWYGYIDRNKFTNGNETASAQYYNVKGWYNYTNNIVRPKFHAGSIPAITDSVSTPNVGETPDTTHTLNGVFVPEVTFIFQNTVGTIAAGGDYEVGATLVYDGNQESDIAIYGSTVDFGVDHIENPHSITAQVWTHDSAGHRSSGGPTVQICNRITHLKCYLRKSSGEVEPWYLAGVFDFDKGAVRIGVAAENNPWTWVSGPKNHKASTDKTVFIEELSETYEGETLIPADTVGQSSKGYSLRYKTSVVAKRRSWVGNIEYYNNQGIEVQHDDIMVKSPVDRYDIYPVTDGYISAASIADGDEIIKLVEFGDKILQFKRKKLIIINISDTDNETVEDIYPERGISNINSAFRTDRGVVWANVHGVFVYDGSNVVNIFAKQDKRLITLTQSKGWHDFLVADKNDSGSGETALEPMIGMESGSNKIMVFDSAERVSTLDPAMYLYDIITGSWSKGSNIYTSEKRVIHSNKTNFVTDWNGDLVFAHNRKGEASGGSDTTMVDLNAAIIDDQYNNYLLYNVTDGGSALVSDSVADTNTLSLGSTLNFTSNEVWLTDRAAISKWDDQPIDSPHSGDMLYETKNFVLGNSSTRKKFYKLYVTYYGGSDLNIEVKYQENMSGNWRQFNPTHLQGSAAWHLAELKPAGALSTRNNIYSIQFQFKTSGADKCQSTFKITELGIVYRTKNLK